MSAAAKRAAQMFIDSAEGGLESAAEYIANWAVGRLYQDPESKFDLEEFLAGVGEGMATRAAIKGGELAIGAVRSGAAGPQPAQQTAQQTAQRTARQAAQQTAQQAAQQTAQQPAQQTAQQAAQQAAEQAPPGGAPAAGASAQENALRLLQGEQARGADTLAAKTREAETEWGLKPGEQAERLAAATQPQDYLLTRPLSPLEQRAARLLLEEFRARNQSAFEQYGALPPTAQRVLDRWLALEYKLDLAPLNGAEG